MMKGHGPVQPDWDNPNRGRHMARPNDPFDGRRGPRAMASSSVGQGRGRGPLQQSPVWHTQRRRRWWICRGNRLVTVAPASTVTATAVATWASDYMQERNNNIGKCV
jgi:hypothetical protein